MGANNRQLHPSERQWAKDNAARYAQYYKEETGLTISTEKAEQVLLGDGYRMVDAAASKGDGVLGAPMYDATATKFINANAGSLFKATVTEYNSPFLYGNSNGSMTPEQQALQINPGSALTNTALLAGLVAAGATAPLWAPATGSAAVDAWTAYRAAGAAYSMGAALGTGAAVGGASYTLGAGAGAVIDYFATGQNIGTGFDQRFSYPGLGAAMAVGGLTGMYSTAMFGWAGVPNSFTNWATIPGFVIRANSTIAGKAAGSAAQGTVNSSTNR